MATTRRAPYVALRTDLVKDERVAVLADIAGYNVFEARGRLFTLWAWCIDRKLADAPEDCEGYAVSEAVVRRMIGPRGVDAILGGGCDEFALAERRPDGLLYLRGTSEYVTKLRELRRLAAAGGDARASGTRDVSGRYRVNPPHVTSESVRKTTIVQPTATREPPETPAVSPAVDQPQPPSDQFQFLDPEEKYIHARPRVRRPDAGRVAAAVWGHAAVCSGKLGLNGITLPRAWPANPDASSLGWLALLDRCEALLVENSPDEAIAIGRRRVDVAAATALRDGHANHFQPSVMFSAKSFDIGSGMDPAAIGKQRDGPRSGSSKRDAIRPTKILE